MCMYNIQLMFFCVYKTEKNRIVIPSQRVSWVNHCIKSLKILYSVIHPTELCLCQHEPSFGKCESSDVRLMNRWVVVRPYSFCTFNWDCLYVFFKFSVSKESFHYCFPLHKAVSIKTWLWNKLECTAMICIHYCPAHDIIFGVVSSIYHLCHSFVFLLEVTWHFSKLSPQAVQKAYRMQ